MGPLTVLVLISTATILQTACLEPDGPDSNENLPADLLDEELELLNLLESALGDKSNPRAKRSPEEDEGDDVDPEQLKKLAEESAKGSNTNRFTFVVKKKKAKKQLEELPPLLNSTEPSEKLVPEKESKVSIKVLKKVLHKVCSSLSGKKEDLVSLLGKLKPNKQDVLLLKKLTLTLSKLLKDALSKEHKTQLVKLLIDLDVLLLNLLNKEESSEKSSSDSSLSHSTEESSDSLSSSLESSSEKSESSTNESSSESSVSDDSTSKSCSSDESEDSSSADSSDSNSNEQLVPKPSKKDILKLALALIEWLKKNKLEVPTLPNKPNSNTLNKYLKIVLRAILGHIEKLNSSGKLSDKNLKKLVLKLIVSLKKKKVSPVLVKLVAFAIVKDIQDKTSLCSNAKKTLSTVKQIKKLLLQLLKDQKGDQSLKDIEIETVIKEIHDDLNPNPPNDPKEE